MMNKQWERELEEEEGEDSFSSLESSEEENDQEVRSDKEDQEMEQMEDHEFRKKRAAPKGLKKVFGGQSFLFGGLPGKNELKMPSIREQINQKSIKPPKKFSLTEFLDANLKESHDQIELQKKVSHEVAEK
jgi:hypothetical protein